MLLNQMGLWIHCFTGSTGLAGMTMVLDRLVCWPEFECVFADNTQKIWACGMEEGGETQGNLSLFMQISSIHGAICCEWFKSEKCHKMRKHNVERNKKLNLKILLNLYHSETWTREYITSDSLFLKMLCKFSCQIER